MKLSILCQSPVPEGGTAARAVHDTVALAQQAEAWGYHRFWVAEHHSDKALGSASPEILVAHLAARTTRIRVGSGGVLLPYYAPLKVAEQFNLLAALHPGRIDLGIGRSTGHEGDAPRALRWAQRDAFGLIDELLGWLGPASGDTYATPPVEQAAAVWVLGTSPASATFAGKRGLPYAFGGFLDPRQVVQALQAYHQAFQPSRHLDRPYVNLGWYAQVADTEAEARRQARSTEHWFVDSFLRGGNAPFPTPERAEAAAASYSPQEQTMLGMKRMVSAVGAPEQVVSTLRELATQLAVDELTVVTIAHDPADRARSYQLLAEAWPSA